jgi:hypothetical protein
VTKLIDLDQITVGSKAWHKYPIDPVADHKGGVVFAISEYMDEDTGEIKRTFETCRAYRGRMRFDSLADTDLGLIEPYNAASVRNAIRGLCADIGLSKGLWTSDQQRLIEVAYRLACSL